jgi:hypothetical protein
MLTTLRPAAASANGADPQSRRVVRRDRIGTDVPRRAVAPHSEFALRRRVASHAAAGGGCQYELRRPMPQRTLMLRRRAAAMLSVRRASRHERRGTPADDARPRRLSPETCGPSSASPGDRSPSARDGGRQIPRRRPRAQRLCPADLRVCADAEPPRIDDSRGMSADVLQTAGLSKHHGASRGIADLPHEERMNGREPDRCSNGATCAEDHPTSMSQRSHDATHLHRRI